MATTAALSVIMGVYNGAAFAATEMLLGISYMIDSTVLNLSVEPRPALAQGKIRWRSRYDFHVVERFASFPDTLFAKRDMIHEPISEALAARPGGGRKVAYRRWVGMREILLLLPAFAFLGLVPSVAQIAPPGGRTGLPAATKIKWAAEYLAENFPGSAFFYLDPHPIAPPVAIEQEADDAPRPFVMRAGSVAHARALQCLTDAIYYEAANEPDAGQRAVAQIVLNRMRHPAYPNSVCGVVYQGSERATGCQFSYSCDGSMAHIVARAAWSRAQYVAAQALAGSVYTPLGLATHYHATYVHPYWAPSLHFVGTIGAHRFYRWKGRAGRQSAFFRRHAEREPFPGPKLRTGTRSPVDDLDPLLLQKKYEKEFAVARSKAEAEAWTAMSARYGGGRLLQATDVKPEFQNSGTWKMQPTG